ncbi:DUF1643 domain-containing protein [Candidatus Peregrinibacteria bacterium]|nr:DUF1643 domain-containing protein [Candidatus Peregrinibacteria bacterium]
MNQGATFSPDRKHRYTLWRIWDEKKPYAMFVGLNPSTADETQNDPTVTRCIGYAKKWGYGGLYMMNIFAFRSTDPKKLRLVRDPIGEKNDHWIKRIAREAGIVVAAWGNHGLFLDRSKAVLELIPHPHCLKLNKNGEPCHPLYLASDLMPQRMG